MSGWIKHPGLYRLFEVGHVVFGADMNREFMFESADKDSVGATLVEVYSRPISLSGSGIDPGLCSTCNGKPTEGRVEGGVRFVCICGGSGLARDEAAGLRAELAELRRRS